MFVFLTFQIKPIKAEQIFVSIRIAFPLRCVHFSKSDSAHKPVIRFHAVDIGFCNGFHAVQSVWNQPQIRHRTHDPRQRQQPMPTLKKGIARFDLPRRRKKHIAYQFALCSLLRFRIAQLYHCMVTGMAEQIRIQSIAEKLFDRRFVRRRKRAAAFRAEPCAACIHQRMKNPVSCKAAISRSMFSIFSRALSFFIYRAISKYIRSPAPPPYRCFARWHTV